MRAVFVPKPSNFHFPHISIEVTEHCCINYCITFLCLIGFIVQFQTRKFLFSSHSPIFQSDISDRERFLKKKKKMKKPFSKYDYVVWKAML